MSSLLWQNLIFRIYCSRIHTVICQQCGLFLQSYQSPMDVVFCHTSIAEDQTPNGKATTLSAKPEVPDCCSLAVAIFFFFCTWQCAAISVVHITLHMTTEMLAVSLYSRWCMWQVTGEKGSSIQCCQSHRSSYGEGTYIFLCLLPLTVSASTQHH